MFSALPYKDINETFFSHPINLHMEHQVHNYPMPEQGMMVHKRTGRKRIIIEGEADKVDAILGKNFMLRVEKVFDN